MDTITEKDKLERLRQEVLKEIAGIGPWIVGSIVIRPGKCRNKKCGCYAGEKLHPPHIYLSWKESVSDKTTTMYVPNEMEAEVREWVDNYKKLKKLLKKGSEIQRDAVRFRER